MSTSRNVPLLFSFLLLVTLADFSIIQESPSSNDFSCNCDYCEENQVVGIEENDSEIDDATNVERDMDTEDFDGDGNRTICARDRDFEDRSFPSICHMNCHNKCTRYRIWIYKVKREKKYIASAFRTDFYKLRDGPC